MKGDFTRSTFDPRKHYSSVRMQQGRVQLDADWNEQMDILGHRIETEAEDVIGRCGFPEDAPGFEIEALNGDGDLGIGAGRAYVDGILCELEAGSEVVTFATQPHLPNAAELLNNLRAGVYFAYLDVWRRHVTAVEAPAIREVALGGPDTATRLQTIWQVKLVEVAATVGDLTCASEPETWKNATAQPGGRLSARTKPADDPKDPCIVPASAGYTQLENQLYRVEVHQGGTLSSPQTSQAPTFKWSRHNGSIVTEWLDKTGEKLRVQSSGRDSVLRFADATWLELTDDARELTGVPGKMRRVNRVEGDVIEIHPIPGDDVVFAEFSPVRKARRWDSAGALEIRRPTDNEGYLPLEAGIEVRFELGEYRTGDYWLIPARAFIGEFSGDIEWPRAGSTPLSTPLALPPHGVEHHYCKLALVEIGADKSFKILSDCRDLFPPLTRVEGGCCDVVVRPGESIQAAIESLPAAGGAVCLKAGLHEISEEIRIERSHVSLCGCPGAQVVRRNGISLVAVSGIVEQVTIEGIGFEVAAGNSESFDPRSPVTTPALITMEDCTDSSLTNCVLSVAAAARPGHLPIAVAAGVVAVGGARIHIRGNEMHRVTLGVFTLHVSHVEVSGNVFVGPLIPGARATVSSGGAVGVWIATDFGASHRVERNLLKDFRIGVRLGGDIVGGGGRSVIAGNDIVRQGPLEGFSDTGGVFAIEVAADECIVRENYISLPTAKSGGIRLAGSDARIESNRIESHEHGSIGIYLLNLNGNGEPVPSSDGVILGNRLKGQIGVAIAIAAVRSVQVLNNSLDGAGVDTDSIGLVLLGSDEAHVVGNRISNLNSGVQVSGGHACRFLSNHLLDGDTGFTVRDVSALDTSRNRVQRMKLWGFHASEPRGTLNLSGDRYAFCGFEAEKDQCFCIGIQRAHAQIGIEGCEVMETGVAADFSKHVPRAIGISILEVSDCRIHGNLVAYSGDWLSGQRGDLPRRDEEHRALLLQGWVGNENNDPELPGGSALVTDNKLIGPGFSCLVEVREEERSQFSRVTFSNNDCFHGTSARDVTGAARHRDDDAATVWLRGSRGIVSGNQIRSISPVPSVHFHGMPSVFVGNSVIRPAIGLPGPLPDPQDKFNLVG